VPIPTANWTSAEFLRDAEELTHGSGNSKVYGVATPLNPLDVAQLFGGQLFNPKTVKMQATSPAVRKAITFEKQWLAHPPADYAAANRPPSWRRFRGRPTTWTGSTTRRCGPCSVMSCPG